MQNITLDKNYRVIPSVENSAQPASSLYEEELDKNVTRVLRLKEAGKIDKKTAEKVLKLLLAQSLEEEFQATLNILLKTKSKPKSRLLFLKFMKDSRYA